MVKAIMVGTLTLLFAFESAAQSVDHFERQNIIRLQEFNALVKKQQLQHEKYVKDNLAAEQSRKLAAHECYKKEAEIFSDSDLTSDVAAAMAFDACFSETKLHATSIMAHSGSAASADRLPLIIATLKQANMPNITKLIILSRRAAKAQKLD